MKPQFVQWGGGNIGRSFIGQVFANNGYGVTFIDVDTTLINALNASSSYVVQCVSGSDVKNLVIEGVCALDARDQEKVDEAITQADLMGVSVGKNVWPHIASSLALALVARHKLKPDTPLDIILAENIHHASFFVSSLLLPHLPSGFPFATYVGLVETSIGKMVPIQEKGDPLTLRSEPYNELIVDKEGFLQPIPPITDLYPVTPIDAYVDRKLFIHNLGHATAAYLGYRGHPDKPLIADVLEDTEVVLLVRKAMMQSSEVLLKHYPTVFTRESLTEHIDDLLSRFSNKALGDTVFRVGRDLTRKLCFDDRLMGIIIEAQNMHAPWDHIGMAYLAALSFTALDADDAMFAPDKKVLVSLEGLSLHDSLYLVSGWKDSDLSLELFEAIAGELERLR
ncbi:MAG: mannitol-1-phosphate 5-dehydrogenase [Sphaerochaeta sp.]|nr:mannitol-1-phosphate 5-dehydrogenase [Sphaerochaeta sp.]